MNYRVKNIGIAVVLAALAAILTSVYVVNYKRHVQNGEGKVTVLVAARDIPAGTSGADVIDKGYLKKQTVPRKAVVDGAISSPSDLASYVATQDVYEGEQVSTRRFAPPKEQGIRAQLKGTQRAYQLEGDANQLLAGTLKDGDYVDFVATWSTSSNASDKGVVSRVMGRNIYVLTAPEGSSESAKVTNPGGGGSVVQLRLTDNQTKRILWCEEHCSSSGGEGGWHLALRPPANATDSGNFIDDNRTILHDGPGRRIR